MKFKTSEERDDFIVSNIPLAKYVVKQCIPMSVSREDREDFTSIAILSLITSVDTYRPELASFSTYAYRVIERAVVREWQKYRKKPDLVEDIEEIATTEDEHTDLSWLLKCLNKEQRDLVYERFWQGKTMPEIARERGITKQAVSDRFKRIFAKLKKNM